MTNLPNLSGFIPQWSLADRIRKAREYAGQSQSELSELAGYSRATIANIEQGKSTARRGQLIAIAFATGVDLNWLETGNTPAGDPGEGGAVGHQGLEPRTRWLGVPA